MHVTEYTVFSVRVPPEPEISADTSVWVMAMYRAMTKAQQAAVRKQMHTYLKKDKAGQREPPRAYRYTYGSNHPVSCVASARLPHRRHLPEIPPRLVVRIVHPCKVLLADHVDAGFTQPVWMHDLPRNQTSTAPAGIGPLRTWQAGKAVGLQDLFHVRTTAHAIASTTAAATSMGIIEAVQLLWSTWGEMCVHAGVGKLSDGRPEGCYVDADGNRSIEMYQCESVGECWASVHGRLGLNIPTREGLVLGVEGDWIIKGADGELSPCKPSIFETVYVKERE